MSSAAEYKKINEKASLEWVSRPDQLIRFRYSSGFYGSCTFVARLIRKNGDFHLDKDSLVVDGMQVRNGNSAVLLGAARDFLILSLRRHPDSLSKSEPLFVQRKISRFKRGLKSVFELGKTAKMRFLSVSPDSWR